MKKLSHKLLGVLIGLGALIFVVAFGMVQSGTARTGPEISLYYSPS